MKYFLAIWMILLSCVICGEDTMFFSAVSPGSSARMVRLGGIEGVSSTSDSVFENPAALYRVNRFSSSFFTTTFMDEVIYQNIALAMRMPVGVLGLGFMNVGVDRIAKTKQEKFFDRKKTIVDYYFNYQNSLLKMSYQFSQSRYVHFGMSASYYYTEFDTVKGEGYNADVGVVLTSDRLDFSFLLRNFMSDYSVHYTDTEIGENSSEGQTEKLSLETLYSLQYKLRHFLICGQIKTVGAERDLYKMGAIEFNPKFLSFFHLSASLKQFPLSNYNEGELIKEMKQSAIFGVTLDLLGINFDYAYERSDHIEYEHKHYFSVGYSF